MEAVKTSGSLMAVSTTNGTDFMAIQLPPWLQIDPIAPARIRLQANQRRASEAASMRAAQAQAQDLQFRRERAAAQDAAEQRAEERKERVFQQTQDQELASAAQQMQMRREAQAEKTRQFEQNLRMRQMAAEREAKSAALQMQGMQAVEKGLKAGQPLQKLIAENAPMLFAKHPERLPSAVPKAVSGPADFTAREIRDEQGNPMGIKAIPGAGGSIKPLPRTMMSPEGMLRADQLRLGVITRQLEENPSDPRLLKSRDDIMARLEQITSGRGGAVPFASGALPGAPSAAPAPAPKAEASTDTIRVIDPNGKSGVVIRSEWDASTDEERKGWEVVDEEEETVTEEVE
jgi:hypothetical protein